MPALEFSISTCNIYGVENCMKIVCFSYATKDMQQDVRNWTISDSVLAKAPRQHLPTILHSKVRPPMKDLQGNGGNQEETHKALFLLQVTTYRSQ